MPTADLSIRHLFGGGWATDFGPNTEVTPDQNGMISIPFLIDAENVFFELDGGPHKIPGTSKLNSSELESGAVIKGLFDYWDIGTAGSPSQHRIIHVGAKIKKDDADGSFSDIFTGLEAGKVPSYSILEDLLIMASDSTTDVPKSWDGTTAQNLAGSPPNFAFSATHKNRSWASGNAAVSSRLYYSALLDGADWIGAGSGSIDIDPRDGDKITAIKSYRNELWIFKGPYKGSIHRITGSAPTGNDAFARSTFVDGLGAVAHNAVVNFANDLAFLWSDGTIRSLKAIDAFGDYSESALSRQIDEGYLGKVVNFNRLNHAYAAKDDRRVYFTIPVNSSTNNNVIIVLDYRFQPLRPSLVTATSGGAIASVIDSASENRQIIMIGGNDGFVRKWNQSTRSIDGTTAISYRVTTPFFTYGVPIIFKTISESGVGVSPKNDGSFTFKWTRDNQTTQTTTITQASGGTDVLGTASMNQFTLGTSALGGARFIDLFTTAPTGTFRAIQYEITQSANNEDLEIHSINATVKGGNWSTEI